MGIRKDTPLVQRISGQTTTVFFKILEEIAKIANSKKKNYEMYFILIFVITMIVVGGSCKNSGCSQFLQQETATAMLHINSDQIRKPALVMSLNHAQYS